MVPTPFKMALRGLEQCLFSDEARFNLSHADGRIRVYRRTSERYADCCVILRDRFGEGSVMMWGGICGGRKTCLLVLDGNLNAQRYINEVLVPEVIPFLLQNDPDFIFQRDNARPHVARVINDFLNQNNVDRLPWPAFSPDFSPLNIFGMNCHAEFTTETNRLTLLLSLDKLWFGNGTICLMLSCSAM